MVSATGLVNAKKSLSSHQLARDLDINRKTALFLQERVRAAMLGGERDLPQGVVEADETYVGGMPRKGRKRDDDQDGGTRRIAAGERGSPRWWGRCSGAARSWRR